MIGLLSLSLRWQAVWILLWCSRKCLRWSARIMPELTEPLPPAGPWSTPRRAGLPSNFETIERASLGATKENDHAA